MVPLKMVPDNSDFITHNVIKKAKMLYWLKTQTFSTKSHSRKRLSFLTTITFQPFLSHFTFLSDFNDITHNVLLHHTQYNLPHYVQKKRKLTVFLFPARDTTIFQFVARFTKKVTKNIFRNRLRQVASSLKYSKTPQRRTQDLRTCWQKPHPPPPFLGPGSRQWENGRSMEQNCCPRGWGY